VVDIRYILAFLQATVNEALELLMALLPKFKIEKYSYSVLGIELTAPWGRSGLGLGIGLGVIDLWVGWPRSQESLHHHGCAHDSLVHDCNKQNCDYNAKVSLTD
jgi:hypothetical protein